MRVRTLLEQRQEGARHAHHAVEVDREQPVEILLADLIEATRERDAGVVEEQVDRRVRGEHRFGVGGDLLAVSYIERVTGHAHAAGGEFRGERLERGGPDVGQRQMTAARGETDGERAADAAARAGDDRGLAAQVEAGHQRALPMGMPAVLSAVARRRKCRAGSSSRLYRVTMRSLK